MMWPFRANSLRQISGGQQKKCPEAVFKPLDSIIVNDFCEKIIIPHRIVVVSYLQALILMLSVVSLQRIDNGNCPIITVRLTYLEPPPHTSSGYLGPGDP
jgi:hypothetical protein